MKANNSVNMEINTGIIDKKILFVSSNIGKEQTGASVCSKRNLEICTTVFGKKNLLTFSLSSFSLAKLSLFKRIFKLLYAIINLIRGYSNGASKSIETAIVDMIKVNQIQFVFIDSSLNGTLVRKIKNDTNAFVVAFFHNCEKYMIKAEMKSGNYLAGVRFFTVCSNEKKTCRFADKIIVLNQRDNNLIEAEYNRKADLLLPISLTDSVDVKRMISRSINSHKRGLFVGSYFFGNIEGLSFFIQNVLPFVEMELIIVGRGMSKFKTDNPNIAIYDGVEDITSFYLNADFVIAPIISGGGMKVKIAEAMMYGKIIIGTPEAFEGYDLIPKSYICKEPSEFIKVINSLSGDSYNPLVRDCFKTKYETDILISHFTKLLNL